MKNLILKSIIILLIAIIESTVSLPVLTFVLFLVWMKKEHTYFIFWLVFLSLVVSIMWGIFWWLSCLFLVVLRAIYQYFGGFISNKILKLSVVVGPLVLCFALVLGIDFHWRVVFYGILSFVFLFIFQKFLLISYENKYL